MPEELELKLEPAKAFDEVFIRQQVCRALRIDNDHLTAFRILKRSIDARKSPVYLLRIEAYLNGETMEVLPGGFNLSEEKLLKRRVAVVGFGPAGIFAAMQLIENGYWPLVIERGKTVKERRRDLAVLNKELVVNPESNYCFGEGGAGTYSDGKLYTRSKKRGNVLKVLQTFVDHGANPDILINAHPHIGTNKLPGIIENMREAIIKAGGDIRFNAKLTDFSIKDGKIESIQVNGNEDVTVDAVILATGHSARDIFELLSRKNVHIEAKPFALGLRIEHPQELIDSIQYKMADRGEYLPPASYQTQWQIFEQWYGGNG